MARVHWVTSITDGTRLHPANPTHQTAGSVLPSWGRSCLWSPWNALGLAHQGAWRNVHVSQSREKKTKPGDISHFGAGKKTTLWSLSPHRDLKTPPLLYLKDGAPWYQPNGPLVTQIQATIPGRLMEAGRGSSFRVVSRWPDTNLRFSCVTLG